MHMNMHSSYAGCTVQYPAMKSVVHIAHWTYVGHRAYGYTGYGRRDITVRIMDLPMQLNFHISTKHKL